MKHIAINTSLGLIILLNMFLFQSCEQFDQRVEGNGNITTQDRSVSQFNEIEIIGTFDVTVTQDSTYELLVITDDNVQPFVKTSVSNNKLKVEIEEDINLNASRLELSIKSSNYSKISTDGVIKLESENRISNGQLTLESDGVNSFDLNVKVNSLRISSNGVTNVDLTGSAIESFIDFDGSGNLSAYNCFTSEMNLSKDGTGKAEIYVLDKLVLSLQGVGNVYCKGDPGYIKQDIDGLGQLILK